MSDSILVVGNSVIVKMLQEEYPDPIANFYVYGTTDTTWDTRNLNLTWTAKQITGFDTYVLRLYDSVGGVAGDLRREILTASTSYEYTYDNNIADTDLGDFPAGNIVARLYTKNTLGELSNLTEKLFTNISPGNVAGLHTSSSMLGCSFYWTANIETDLLGYYFQIIVEDINYTPVWDEVEVQLTTGVEVTRILSTEEIASYPDPKIFFRVRAVDVFGGTSDSVSTSRVPGSFAVTPTDIADFSLSASKMFWKIPVLESDAWQDNTPSTGYISWNSHKLYYAGAEYQIAAGTTNKMFVYWVSGNVYLTSDTNPSLADNEFVIATNVDGYHDLAWNAIANSVIGSAYIMKGSIETAHIGNAQIISAHISGKLTVGVTEADRTADSTEGQLVNSWKFNSTEINGAKIKTGSLYLNYIYVTGGPPANADNTSQSYIGTIVSGWRYGTSTEINGAFIRAGTIRSDQLISIAYDKVYNGPPINADNTANAISSTSIGQRVIGWGHTNNATLIDGGDIYTGSIYANQLATDSVISDKIKAGAITTLKIGALQVKADHIDVGAIIAGKLAVDSIVTNNIQARNIVNPSYGYVASLTMANIYTPTPLPWYNGPVVYITTEGNPVDVSISCSMSSVPTPTYGHTFRVFRYGYSDSMHTSLTVYDASYSLNYLETPVAGYYAYVFQATGIGTIFDMSLKVIEYKR